MPKGGLYYEVVVYGGLTVSTSLRCIGTRYYKSKFSRFVARSRATHQRTTTPTPTALIIDKYQKLSTPCSGIRSSRVKREWNDDTRVDKRSGNRIQVSVHSAR